MSNRTMVISLAGIVLGAALPAAVTGATLVYDADPLGRLFTTPQERRKLDDAREQAARAGTPMIADEAPEPDQEVTVQPAPSGILVKGVVSRSQGPDTAWVDGGNTIQMDSTATLMKVETIDKDPGAVSIGSTDGKSSRTVRVGETFEPRDETVTDLIDPYSNPGAPARVRTGQPQPGETDR